MAKEYGEEERIAMDELKKRMKGAPEHELYEDDSVLYRFLKARDFNIDHAEKMLREHLEWRKKYDVKNISKCKHPEVLENHFAFNKLGHDKEGCVLRYLPTGDIDWIGLNASCKLDDLAKRLIHYFERDFEDLKRYSEETGKTADKVAYILNMEHFSFAQATNKKVISSFIFLINLYQNNYPETLKVINIINASTYFYLLFTLMKNFVPTAILNKFKIYTDDSWKEDLANSVDTEILPAFLGGKKTDPDGNPLCITSVNHGGSVPPKYYIHRSKRSLANLPDVKKLTLSRAAFHEVFMEVTEPGCYLEWEFETKSSDIGFGLFHQDEKENKTQIIPIERIRTDEYSETGIYKCENVGTYIAVFDNTYSFLRKKDVFYKIKVIQSHEEESQIVN